MSYIVATMQKFDRSMIKGMQSHNQREHESRTNTDIDKTKEHLNYDLINDRPINYLEVIDNRLGELPLKRKPRKDAVLINSFIIGSDQEFFKSLTSKQTKQYFQESVDWFVNRYGQENVKWAMVHLDEPTPHMHIGVMPVTSDLRLSSKDLFDRNELRAIQSELHADVGLKWGLERGKEGSDRKRLSELEYKTSQEKLKLEKVQEQTKKLDQSVSHLKKEYSSFKADHETAFDGNYKSPFLDKDSVIVPKETLKKLQKQASLVSRAKSNEHTLKSKIERLENDYDQQRKRVRELVNENKEISNLYHEKDLELFIQSHGYQAILKEHGLESEIDTDKLELYGRTEITNQYDLDSIEKRLGKGFNQETVNRIGSAEQKGWFIQGMQQAKERIQDWFTRTIERIQSWTHDR